MTDDQVGVRAILNSQAKEPARVVGTVTVISESMSCIFFICDFNRVKESWSASAHVSCEFPLAVSARLHQGEWRVKQCEGRTNRLTSLAMSPMLELGAAFTL